MLAPGRVLMPGECGSVVPSGVPNYGMPLGMMSQPTAVGMPPLANTAMSQVPAVGLVSDLCKIIERQSHEISYLTKNSRAGEGQPVVHGGMMAVSNEAAYRPQPMGWIPNSAAAAGDNESGTDGTDDDTALEKRPRSGGATSYSCGLEALTAAADNAEAAGGGAVPGKTSKQKPRKRSFKLMQQDSGMIRACTACGTTDTPKWRCGMTLCNACGLRTAKEAFAGTAETGPMPGSHPPFVYRRPSSPGQTTNDAVAATSKKSSMAQGNHYATAAGAHVVSAPHANMMPQGFYPAHPAQMGMAPQPMPSHTQMAPMAQHVPHLPMAASMSHAVSYAPAGYHMGSQGGMMQNSLPPNGMPPHSSMLIAAPAMVMQQDRGMQYLMPSMPPSAGNLPM